MPDAEMLIPGEACAPAGFVIPSWIVYGVDANTGLEAAGVMRRSAPKKKRKKHMTMALYNEMSRVI